VFSTQQDEIDLLHKRDDDGFLDLAVSRALAGERGR
jgi:hypothetical protein